MKETYTIPTWEKDNIDKAIARFKKKADKYGTSMNIECGEPYAKERTVYKVDEITKEKYAVDTELVEVYDLTVECDVIRKDGYTVVAKIEHLENGNFVSSFIDDPKEVWTKLESACEHCHTKHYRKNTFIVRHEDGTDKQVGSTCLKDYCGIDPQRFVEMKQLTDLLLQDDFEDYDFDHAPRAKAVYPFVNALALSYGIYKSQGYRKVAEYGSNKEKLADLLSNRTEPKKEELEVVKSWCDDVLGIKRSDKWSPINDLRIWFDNTMKPLIEAKYCKDTHLGYVAYAPVAFEKYARLKIEEEQKAKRLSEQAESSDYVGEVGEKIDVSVKEMNLLTSWEGDWGWTYLYKIIDVYGNVMVWYASHKVKVFDKFRATVKSHNERDGIKQTIVTRCRAI